MLDDEPSRRIVDLTDMDAVRVLSTRFQCAVSPEAASFANPT
jgi:hypothetical protein